MTAQQLRAVQDKAITEIVKLQHGVGLQSIIDGEFRRTCFHTDFLEQLALTPQCGFSSTVEGNNIAAEAQRAKLRLVVETATEVWQ